MSLFQSVGNHISKTIATLGLGLALISGSALAEENQTLDEAYQILVNSYYSINGFYNFSANQADKQQNEVIQESIDNIDSLIESLGDSFVDTPQDEAVTDAKEKWQAYRKKLSQNVKEVEKTGYPDLRLAGDMANSNIAFNNAISQSLRYYKRPKQALRNDSNSLRRIDYASAYDDKILCTLNLNS